MDEVDAHVGGRRHDAARVRHRDERAAAARRIGREEAPDGAVVLIKVVVDGIARGRPALRIDHLETLVHRHVDARIGAAEGLALLEDEPDRLAVRMREDNLLRGDAIGHHGVPEPLERVAHDRVERVGREDERRVGVGEDLEREGPRARPRRGRAHLEVHHDAVRADRVAAGRTAAGRTGVPVRAARRIALEAAAGEGARGNAK